MLLEYGINQLDPDDESERQEKLTTLPFSVIVEGSHDELESLEKWMGLTFDKEAVSYLYHGKTGYDFGFAEYFFDDVVKKSTIVDAVPRMYLVWPDPPKPDKVWRSLGYYDEEIADPNDKTAIILYLDTN